MCHVPSRVVFAVNLLNIFQIFFKPCYHSGGHIYYRFNHTFHVPHSLYLHTYTVLLLLLLLTPPRRTLLQKHMARQSTSHILWNTNSHHRVHKSPPFVSVLRHINPAHGFPFYFIKIHFNISYLSTPRVQKWSPFRFRHRHTVNIIIIIIIII
jgi:hypothetical protein